VPHSSTRPYSVKEPSPSKARPSESASFSHAKESADSVGNYPTVESVRGSKTLFARPSKPRPSAQDVFPETLGKPFGSKREATSNKARARSPGSSANSSEPVSKFPPPSKMSSRTSTDSGDPLSTSKLSNAPKVPSSSATLRETIAKAKAARQKVNKIQGTGPVGNRQQAEASPDFDFDDTASILRKRVASARTDGRLNIAALGLNKMPSEVTNMYNANPGDGSWYESVDLVRLIAADNEFEHLDDGSFPDEDPESDEAEDEYQGNMFGGLETLDLHGNHLKALPMGLRRLERLTTLNVSKNKLNNESISKIARIRSLRELRLADNALNGTLDAELCDLKSLEVLDLHNNMISNLPSNLHELSNLRTINIAGNRLSLLPFDCFSALPLVELDVARNRLSGTLFPPGMQGFPGLKTLDVANNALTAFTQNAVVCLPSLQALNVTENRLTALPDISSWTELITLTAGGNQISSFPEGLTALTRVKTLDFSRNDIRKLDEQIGLMESLAVLRIANNPLRERRFLNMDTDEIKHELKLRLLPEETADTMVCESRDASDMAPNGSMESSRVWPVKPGGMLDRSSTRLETVESTDLEPFVGTNNVKTFVLNRNQLSRIPSSLELLGHSLVKIDMSHNKLNAATYLPDEISLPNLRSLDLSSNAISTLSPIVDNLFAPRMTELDMSRNRLTSLLPLRSKFVSLISLSAADNSISVLEVGVAQGLRVMDISGNELTHLEPKLGLLDADGLRTLLVGGNRFRVPRREVIDKGTEAVLTWLKSRIPDEELHES